MYSQIDEAIVNDAWMNVIPTKVMAMEPLFSDDSLLGLILEDQEYTQKRPFRFYNCLVKQQKFKEKVQAGWHITGDGLKGIWKNLKVVRREMQKLNTKEFNGVVDRVQRMGDLCLCKMT